MRTSDDTRARLLDVAWELLREGGGEALTMGAVARAAGVSRQLVYLHFENRAGLLVEMARRYDRTSGFIGRVLAARELAPVQAFESLVRAWCGYVPDIYPAASALHAAHIAGDDGTQAWADRMADLREAFRLALQRVADDGRLADGWTVAEAADWAYARAHIDVWSELVLQRGWTQQAYAERLVASVTGELVRRRRRVSSG